MTITRTLVLLAAAVTAVADNSGTVNLPVGTSFSFDKGTVVTSGGDILFSGISINVQGAASAANLGNGSQAFAAVTATQISIPQLYNLTQIIGANLAVNDVFAVQTNAANYAKVLITAYSASSVTLQYVTYGNATGGGGGNVPTISVVQNNYGNLPLGLPNYGIAPGSLFYVQGSALAGVTTALLSSASPGLQTTVSNVSVTVTVGGTTVNCPIYYVSPTQIDAVLPGNTPVGTGTITVTNNTVKSSTAPIVVVQSAFGILSYNGTLAATYDANNSLIAFNNAANPGQTIVIYGSGVGADSLNDDRIFPQKQDNLTSTIPIQVYVGGVQATVAYAGRSQFPGVDQINVVIPNSVPTGCYVSIAVVSNNVVSNGATIPVAASGRTCSEPNSLFQPGFLQTVSGKVAAHTGILALNQTVTVGAGVSNTTTNTITGILQSVNGTAYAGGFGANQVSSGSCLVTNTAFTTAFGGTLTTTPLDAGSTITVTGPQSNIGLTRLAANSFYTASSVPTNFIPAAGGTFTFDNGAGGLDVGHFNTVTNFPANFAWTNPSTLLVNTRSAGLTVTWSGGAPGATVTISGTSISQLNGQSASAGFTCQAPLSAGTFTVPPSVLLALPATTTGLTGTLSITDNSTPQTFTATGLDAAFEQNMITFKENVQYN